jgi:hypothetical protein
MQFFLFLNLDYLQLQRENASREKMQAIFWVLETKKDLIQKKKKKKRKVKVVKTLNKWCKQSSSKIWVSRTTKKT